VAVRNLKAGVNKMSLRIFSVAAVGLLTVVSLSACSKIAAHERAFINQQVHPWIAQNADPITGEWNASFYDNGRVLPAVFKLRLERATISGSASSAKTGEGIIRDGEWSDGKLSFVVDFKEHKSLIVEGVLKDGKLAGECHHPDGPIYKWEATAVTRGDALISGEWSVTFYVHDMKTPATFTFKLDGAKVTGTAYSEHTGSGTIRDGKWADGKLSFTLDFARHESIAVTGALQGDKLSGQFTTEGFTDKWEAIKK
jgi:hypothetical protein